jgi:hypothetical protein
MPKPENAWQQIGLTDPYYGVSTHEQYRRENLNAEILKEFFLGERDLEQVLAFIWQYLDGSYTAKGWICWRYRATYHSMARICCQRWIDISKLCRQTRKNLLQPPDRKRV